MSRWLHHCTSVSGPFHTCYSEGSAQSTGVLLALLQFHVAHPNNLAHKADARPDEVSAAEVLKEQRAHKGVSLRHPVTSAYFLMLKTRMAPLFSPRTQELSWHQGKMTGLKTGENSIPQLLLKCMNRIIFNLKSLVHPFQQGIQKSGHLSLLFYILPRHMWVQDAFQCQIK